MDKNISHITSFSIQSIFKLIALILFAWAMCIPAIAQNINGEPITVGKEAITIINFPDDVLNVDLADQSAYDYYVIKRREMKSISIQFNKEKETAPGTSLLVNEGGRSHMFKILFDATYDINDNSRPPLWYDHSSLKELKAFVKKQGEMANMNSEQIAQQQKKDKDEAIAKKQKDYAEAQKQKEIEDAKKQKEIQVAKAEEDKKQQVQQAEIKRIKDEAEAKEKAAQIAKANEEAARKEAARKEKEQATLLAQQNAEEEARLKKIKEQQDADALAKAQADAEHKRQVEEQRIAQEKATNEARIIAAEEVRKQKEAEQEAALQKLAQIEAERKTREETKRYSLVGLWQQYGSKGINLYDIPPGQMSYLNADFYVAADTLRFFEKSEQLIHASDGSNLGIAAQGSIDKGLNISLENMEVIDAHVYYKLKIHNATNDDFLMGKTYMYWYDANKNAKKPINCSYITCVGFFPLVKPSETKEIVFVTRFPNVSDDESLVLFTEDRREGKGTTSITIPGIVYNKELNRNVQTISPLSNPEKINEAPPQNVDTIQEKVNRSHKKSKRERKNSK